MRRAQTPLEQAREFAKALRAKDQAAAKILVEEFLRVVARITPEIERFVREGASLVARDRNQRLEVIRAQVVAELEAFAGYAAGLITIEQRAAIGAAIEDAQSLFLLSQARSSSQVVASASWTVAPTEALYMLVGKLADGSTIDEYLRARARETWPEIRSELIKGLAAGRNPRRVAAKIRQAMNGNLVSALITSRESLVGTYNEATLEQFRANADLMKGYIRLSALGPRTCALCWALHGKFYELGEPFLRHLNCRCTLVPWIEGAPIDVGNGEAMFRNLSAEAKKKILHPGEYELYRNGKIILEDLVAVQNSKRWGKSLRRKTLVELEAE